MSPGIYGDLGICRGFPAVGLTGSQRSLAPERVPSVVAAGATSVDQAVHALGASSWILVTGSSGKVTFIDGRHKQLCIPRREVISHALNVSLSSLTVRRTAPKGPFLPGEVPDGT